MPEWLAVAGLTALVLIAAALSLWAGRDSDANG